MAGIYCGCVALCMLLCKTWSDGECNYLCRACAMWMDQPSPRNERAVRHNPQPVEAPRKAAETRVADAGQQPACASKSSRDCGSVTVNAE
jgi:hypothetical protein